MSATRQWLDVVGKPRRGFPWSLTLFTWEPRDGFAWEPGGAASLPRVPQN